jgi:hypothetical protein
VTILANPFSERCAFVQGSWRSFRIESNATAKERVGYGIPWVPHTEVWYPEPLALSWATSCILVYPTEPIQYKVFKLNSDSYKSESDEVLATI